MKQTSRFIKFMGGKNLLYLLVLLILIGITILIYNKISFIFHPIIVIFSTIMPPTILAFIAYYLLNPIVDFLERFRIKRIWGIIILILGIGGLLTGLILLIAPSIEVQVKDLAKNFPNYLNHLGNVITMWLQNSFLGPYYDEGYNWFVTNFSNIPGMVGTYLVDAFQGFRNVASTVTNVFVSIITFPFILFFLLKDGTRFRDFFLKLLPPKFRDDTNQILKNMDTQVGSYIQGQIIVASCIGLLLFVGYNIIGLDYAITLAIVAATTSVIPYLGPTIAITPAIIIAIVHSPFMLLKLAIVWIVVQFLEGNFISPNIMGKTMQIHPLTIIIVLLVAGNLFGLIGVILGIPGYAILKVLVSYLYNKFKNRYNHYYGDEYGKY
ncbi:AI-2E family transporter [Oceanobacillus caeni]|uniref:AI-2E family transporter n=1 Tax=Oceanobacillus TaxID=182709 RepID=UPI0006228DC7|nr:AI-2E family transporter [Oceanobacillus caeni]KKE78845.1 membrane protein [Bacilli bacterium VT-13-104]PZD85141.1 AI-2E family transporter [Bacilli bacterium]MBU8791253.1 AI-2E family transporter [Oceanobacillus caeni]MCR1834905.1 AI-2E family transporter [Oceanobacillus caeni]MED4475957.1 AI-2E family transporter [Oceanobacillus caeni]